MIPLLLNSHWTEPDSPSLPLCRVNAARTSAAVRFRLSVAASTMTTRRPDRNPRTRRSRPAPVGAAGRPVDSLVDGEERHVDGSRRSMARRSRKLPLRVGAALTRREHDLARHLREMAPRFTSLAPFWRLIWDHWMSDIGLNTMRTAHSSGESNRWLSRARAHSQCPVTWSRRLRQEHARRTLAPSGRCDDRLARWMTGRAPHTDPRSKAPHHHQMALASFTHEGTRSTSSTPRLRRLRGDQHAPSARGCRDRSRRWFGGIQVGTQSVWDELEKTKTPGSSCRRSTARTGLRQRPEAARDAYGIRWCVQVPVGTHQAFATIDLSTGILKAPKDPIGELRRPRRSASATTSGSSSRRSSRPPRTS